MQSFQPADTSSLSGTNILLITLFSNTLNLCSFLKPSDQFSHEYKPTHRTIYVYILILMCLDRRREHKWRWTEW
jgi:hypothetical protein